MPVPLIVHNLLAFRVSKYNQNPAWQRDRMPPRSPFPTQTDPGCLYVGVAVVDRDIECTIANSEDFVVPSRSRLRLGAQQSLGNRKKEPTNLGLLFPFSGRINLKLGNPRSDKLRSFVGIHGFLALALLIRVCGRCRRRRRPGLLDGNMLVVVMVVEVLKFVGDNVARAVGAVDVRVQRSWSGRSGRSRRSGVRRMVRCRHRRSQVCSYGCGLGKHQTQVITRRRR